MHAGWEWEGPWELENSGYVDKEGWTYGVDFGNLEYPPAPGNQRKALQHFVRRRRYVRRRRQVSRSLPSLRTTSDQQLAERAEAEAEETERVVLGSVQPGDSLPLPLGWRSSGEPPGSTAKHLYPKVIYIFCMDPCCRRAATKTPGRVASTCSIKVDRVGCHIRDCSEQACQKG